jgi:Tol biopolymer transport system component
MTIGGNHFTSNSVVEWNGSPLATTLLPTAPLSDQILSVQVAASMVAEPGSAQITVKDTSTGAVSNTVVFSILSPAAATAGVVQLISIAPDGSAANGDSLVTASISETGRYISFQSSATNLTSGPANGIEQIYLRDTCIGADQSCVPSTELVTVTEDGLPPNGQNWESAVSADGRFVVFDSNATNIVPQTGNCGISIECVYIRDMCTGVVSGCVPETTLASAANDGTVQDGANPTITPDGRYLAFNSTGSSPGVNQIVVRDTCHGAPPGCTPSTFTDSLNVAGQPGSENSLGQQLTPDGRFAAFVTYSTNMPGPNEPPVSTGQSFWVRDTCLGAAAPCTPTTTREDVASNGTVANGNLDIDAEGSISNTGRYVSVASEATNLVSQNVNSFTNVYWRDTCTGVPAGCQPSTILASLGNDGSIGNSNSFLQSMSEDGRFVVFTSLATNLVAFDNFAAGSWQEIYGRDTCTGAPAGRTPSTVRLAVTTPQPGAFVPGNEPSGYPVISGDGHYVVFLSSSTNFFPSINVQNAMVYLAKTGF